MEKLIQTSECSIIYGEFRGKKDQELFRCARSLDDKDLVSFVNKERVVLDLVDDETEDLRDVPGMHMIGFWRMYYRDGWQGRWMLEGEDKPSARDCYGVNKIIDFICDQFPKGCDYKMQSYFEKHHVSHAGGKRFLLRPQLSDVYKVMIDTTYGNGDYPVRIYVYREEKEGGEPYVKAIEKRRADVFL